MTLTRKDTNPKDALGIRKVPISTIPIRVLWRVGLALLEGALKYGRSNYRVAGVRASVYFDACQSRHLSAWWEGQDIDPDSGLHHIDKAIASLVVLRDGILTGNWVDDRPPVTCDMDEEMAALNAHVEMLLAKYPNPEQPYTEIGEQEKKCDWCDRLNAELTEEEFDSIFEPSPSLLDEAREEQRKRAEEAMTWPEPEKSFGDPEPMAVANNIKVQDLGPNPFPGGRDAPPPLTETEVALLEGEGWDFVPTRPEEWEWLKIEAGLIIARQGSPTWYKDLALARGQVYGDNDGCRTCD